VLLISYRFSTVREAARMYALDDGPMTESGGREELMDRATTYAELFTLQPAAYRRAELPESALSCARRTGPGVVRIPR
jgi:ABC-type transport system involved in cytochrome bd biosynthesis fused ATPase/permease subunit